MRTLEADFLKNKASNETNLFHIFDLFSHVRSPLSGCTINIGTPCIYMRQMMILYKDYIQIT